MAITKKTTNAGSSLTTPKFRVSYPNLFKPRVSKDFPDKEPTFSIDMVFAKDTDLTEIKKAINKAKIDKWGPKESWPKRLRSPFKDGNEKTGTPEEYKDTLYATATSQRKVPVFDRDGKSEIIESDGSFYPGCFARAKLVIYTYDAKGNCGVAFGLRGVQKFADGEALGGGQTVKSGDFDSVEDNESDDEDVSDEDDVDADDLI